MSRTNRWTYFMIAALLFGAACDRSEPDDAQLTRQLQLDQQGHVWRTLMQQLPGAQDDETRVRMLERFIEQNPDHPDVAEAKRRVELLTAEPVDPAQELLAKPVQEGIEEGNPRALALLTFATGVERVSPRQSTKTLPAPIEVPTSKGMKSVDGAYLVDPGNLAWFGFSVARTYVPDDVPGACARTCVGEVLGGLFAKSLGGRLYLSSGKLDPDVVGPLLEQAWIGPHESVLGVSAKRLYDIAQPTAAAFIKVGLHLEKSAPAAAEKLAGLGDDETLPFYEKFAIDNGVAKLSDGPPHVTHAIAGWWVRRHADGTAKLFMDFGRKVAEGYEPALLD